MTLTAVTGHRELVPNPTFRTIRDLGRNTALSEMRAPRSFRPESRAKMRPDSDIDLLVEFMPDAKISLFGHFDGAGIVEIGWE